MALMDDVRGSFSDISAAVQNTINPPAGVSPVRGALNFLIVALIGAFVFFPLIRKVPYLSKVVPK